MHMLFQVFFLLILVITAITCDVAFLVLCCSYPVDSCLFADFSFSKFVCVCLSIAVICACAILCVLFVIARPVLLLVWLCVCVCGDGHSAGACVKKGVVVVVVVVVMCVVYVVGCSLLASKPPMHNVNTQQRLVIVHDSNSARC